MKQIIKLDVIAPGSAYDLSFTGVYQAENKLIALAKLESNGMIGTCALQGARAAVSVDVAGSNKLPVEIYLVGKACCEPKGYKEVNEEEAQKLIEGLTALKHSSVDVDALNESKEETSLSDKAKNFLSSHPSLKDRNTLFAAAAVTGAVAIAGALTLLSKRM